MTLKSSYATETEARADLRNHSFELRTFDGRDYWRKPSTNQFGMPMVAIAVIERQTVDPRWNAPDYFTVEFRNH